MAFEDRRHPGLIRGRHRRARRRSLVLLSLLVVASAVGVTAYARGDRSAGGCEKRRDLAVVAAPELAPAVETVSTFLRCVRVTVTAGDPSTVARQVASGSAPADVWIPDSSRWVSVASGPSVAWTPVVLAVDADDLSSWAVPATFEGVARAAGAGEPLQLTAEDPSRSATTQATVSGLVDALSATPTLRGHLAALLRGMDAPEAAGTGSGTTALQPSTEQAVWARNAESGSGRLEAVYPPAPGRMLDYPFVVTATDAEAREDAQTLLDRLTGPAGTAVVEGLGFRSPAGTVNATLGAVGEQHAEPRALTSRDARAALRLVATLNRSSRLLALVDVSGSMDQVVPGTARATRIELARDAIRGALRLLPDGTVAGVWRFSSDLTPSTNYEQVMPLRPLTDESRHELAAAIDELSAVPYGGTGLYDSVLAAVRYVRAGYDPGRVNSVVVLSDGRNEHASAHGITKDELLDALREEGSADRPVQVISVAYGPDSDVAALRAISEATGGSVYVAQDPRDLPVIFRDAIGDRLCQDRC